MRVLAGGFWGTAHWTLDLIGRGTARFGPRKTPIREDEAYSMMGGAVVSGTFGAIVGLLLADQSHTVNAVTGATSGFLVGVCAGVIVGATVQVVDDWIKEQLNSVGSKNDAPGTAKPSHNFDGFD
jgi:hypothetical protein